MVGTYVAREGASDPLVGSLANTLSQSHQLVASVLERGDGLGNNDLANEKDTV